MEPPTSRNRTSGVVMRNSRIRYARSARDSGRLGHSTLGDYLLPSTCLWCRPRFPGQTCHLPGRAFARRNLKDGSSWNRPVVSANAASLPKTAPQSAGPALVRRDLVFFLPKGIRENPTLRQATSSCAGGDSDKTFHEMGHSRSRVHSNPKPARHPRHARPACRSPGQQRIRAGGAR